MKALVSIALACLLAPPLLAQSWSLEECPVSADRLEAHAEFRRTVQSARPDTPLYTPHPYPKTDNEVIQNFKSYHFLAHSDSSLEEMRTRDRDFFRALKSHGLSFEVIRVTNWTPLRCGPRKNRELFHIIRMFDRSSQIEVARASVDDTGHVTRLRLRPGRGFSPIPPLATVAGQIRSSLGLRPANLQYVATWGTVRCDEVSPCIAFRQNHRTFLRAAGDSIFEFQTDAPGYSASRELTPARRGPILDRLKQEGRELVSIGGDTYRAAVPVEPPAP